MRGLAKRRPRSGLLGAVLLAIGVAIAGVAVLTAVAAFASPSSHGAAAAGVSPSPTATRPGFVDPVVWGVLVTADQRHYAVLSDNNGQQWGSACTELPHPSCTRVELTGTVIVTGPLKDAGRIMLIAHGDKTRYVTPAGCHLALAGAHGFTYYYLRSGQRLGRTNLQLLCISGVLKIEWR